MQKLKIIYSFCKDVAKCKWNRSVNGTVISNRTAIWSAKIYKVTSRGLHGSNNSYPNPKRPVNMLHGTDPEPYFIWKWDPNLCRPEKCLKCTTQTRPLFESWTRTQLGRDRPDCTRPDRHILHSKLLFCFFFFFYFLLLINICISKKSNRSDGYT